MTHGPLSWRELVERDKQKSEDARGQIKRAAMPVQADPVAELRAEITRLTEALRAAEEREKELRSDAERYHWLRDHSCPPHNFYISVPDEFAGQRYAPDDVDAYIDAARQALAGAKP